MHAYVHLKTYKNVKKKNSTTIYNYLKARWHHRLDGREFE